MKTRSLTIILTLLSVANFALHSQEIIKPVKRMYRSDDGKIFVNKDLPVYFRIATSGNENAESYILPSETTPQYANPMYLDTEGNNTFHSPVAVDTVTKKIVHPAINVIYNIYADGVAPTSHPVLSGSKEINIKGKRFYRHGLKIELKSTDATSGVEDIYFSMNGEAYKKYTQAILPEDEMDYTLKYYATDHVGNYETPKQLNFSLDNTSPVTAYSIEGKKNKNMIGADAIIRFSSKDSLSGVKEIRYRINKGKEIIYTQALPVSVLLNQNSEITYYAIDNAGNSEPEKTLKTIANQEKQSGESALYSFYIDNQAPVAKLVIEGDQFQGKYLFISGRSKIKIEADDDKSGVDVVKYSFDNSTLNNSYTEPFTANISAAHLLCYSVIDFVGNKAAPKTSAIYIDEKPGTSNVTINGTSFRNRDTLFINTSTRFILTGTDSESGLKQLQYKLDNGSYITYTTPITVSEAGFHTLSYQSIDKVNNTEKEKSISFVVDNTPPSIYHHFSVDAIGSKQVRNENLTIYPSNAVLYLAATDNLSGNKRISYKINGGIEQNKMPISGLQPGNYEIEIVCLDELNNRNSEKIKFAIEK